MIISVLIQSDCITHLRTAIPLGGSSAQLSSSNKSAFIVDLLAQVELTGLVVDSFRLAIGGS